MSFFICPVCNGTLNESNRSLICSDGHCYDIAKSGYVNLLMSQKNSSRNHGDDKEMIKARRSFLEKDYYLPLKENLCETVKLFSTANAVVLDCGCGEGYYTKGIAESLAANSTVLGIDISKDAVTYAAKHCPDAHFAVASSYKLPLANNSCDIIISVFAPYSASEVKRILKPKGVFIEVSPMPMHLMELKNAVYEKAYENEVPPVADGLNLIKQIEIRGEISLFDNNDIVNLFQMTPYSHKTSPKDKEKLLTLNSLVTRTEFYISIYEQ